MAKAANNANGQIDRPSAKRLRSPKKPVSMQARASGMSVPMAACSSATCSAIVSR